MNVSKASILRGLKELRKLTLPAVAKKLKTNALSAYACSLAVNAVNVVGNGAYVFNFLATAGSVNFLNSFNSRKKPPLTPDECPQSRHSSIAKIRLYNDKTCRPRHKYAKMAAACRKPVYTPVLPVCVKYDEKKPI